MLMVFATITEVAEQTSGVLEEGRASDLLVRVQVRGAGEEGCYYLDVGELEKVSSTSSRHFVNTLQCSRWKRWAGLVNKRWAHGFVQLNKYKWDLQESTIKQKSKLIMTDKKILTILKDKSIKCIWHISSWGKKAQIQALICAPKLAWVLVCAPKLLWALMCACFWSQNYMCACMCFQICMGTSMWSI